MTQYLVWILISISSGATNANNYIVNKVEQFKNKDDCENFKKEIKKEAGEYFMRYHELFCVQAKVAR